VHDDAPAVPPGSVCCRCERRRRVHDQQVAGSKEPADVAEKEMMDPGGLGDEETDLIAR
jgi:hypothetical protein